MENSQSLGYFEGVVVYQGDLYEILKNFFAYRNS